MQSTRLTFLARLARPRSHPRQTLALGHNHFSSTRVVFGPTVTSTTPSPLSTQPVSEPRHGDAYAHASPAPPSHTPQTPRYVDAHPDPPGAATRYDVPSGPYASPAPYAHTHVTSSASPTTDLSASSISKEDLSAFEPSSTSTTPAHPLTTQRVPRVPLAPHPSTASSTHSPTEYAESPSSAVRNASSPGVMKAAEEGGLGIMESEGRVMYPDPERVGELPERNPPPLSEEAEEISRAGVSGAWKLRK